MKRKLLFTIISTAVMAISSVTAVAQTSCRLLPPVSTQKNASMEFVVVSATPHPDDCLVRVKGNLLGRPHTSGRIDGVLLVNGTDTIAANDIDGVDFRRYFQWEDEGIIELEIDFPGTKAKPVPKVGPKSVLIFNTVNGDYRFAQPAKRK